MFIQLNYKLTKVSKYFKTTSREDLPREFWVGCYKAGPFFFKICPNNCTIVIRNEGRSLNLLSDLFPIIYVAWELSEKDIIQYSNEELVIRYDFAIINNYFKNIVVFI